MDLMTARNVDPAVLTAAFETMPKPAFKALNVNEDGTASGRHVAVYSRSGPEGELVGLMTWQDALIALSAARGHNFLPGEAMMEDGDVADTVGQAESDRVARLTARRAEHVSAIAKIDERLA